VSLYWNKDGPIFKIILNFDIKIWYSSSFNFVFQKSWGRGGLSLTCPLLPVTVFIDIIIGTEMQSSYMLTASFTEIII
jgi:hypothetical protein